MIKVHQLVQENKSIHEEAFGLNLKTVFEDISWKIHTPHWEVLKYSRT